LELKTFIKDITGNMIMKFKNYYNDKLQLENDIITLLEISIFFDELELNENKVMNTITSFMKKMGLSVHHREGLFHHLKRASKSINKLIMLAFKNDKEGMKKHIQEMNISKADVLDVLLKLDVLTLHVISYPLHVIDAVTG
jgi:hypothetical protein